MQTELVLELPEEIRRKIWQDWVIQGWKDALIKELTCLHLYMLWRKRRYLDMNFKHCKSRELAQRLFISAREDKEEDEESDDEESNGSSCDEYYSE